MKNIFSILLTFLLFVVGFSTLHSQTIRRLDVVNLSSNASVNMEVGIPFSGRIMVTVESPVDRNMRNTSVTVTLPSNFAGITLKPALEVDLTGFALSAATRTATFDPTQRTYTISGIDNDLTAGVKTRSFYIPFDFTASCDEVINAFSNVFLIKAHLKTELIRPGATLVTNYESTFETGKIMSTATSANVRCERHELLCSGQSVLLTAQGTGFTSYQWKRNGVDIPGATSQQYLATQSGNYMVLKKVKYAVPSNPTNLVDADIAENIILSDDTQISGDKDPIRLAASGIGHICASTGVWESHFYLCNTGDRKKIQTGIKAGKVEWFKNVPAKKADGLTLVVTPLEKNYQCPIGSEWVKQGEGSDFEISYANPGAYRAVITAEGCSVALNFSVLQGFSGSVTASNASTYAEASVSVTMDAQNTAYTYVLKKASDNSVVATANKPASLVDSHIMVFNDVESVENVDTEYIVEVTSATAPACKFTERVKVTKVTQMKSSVTFNRWTSCQEASFDFFAEGGKTPYSVAIYEIDGILQYPGVSLENIPNTAFTVQGASGADRFSGVFRVTSPGKAYKFVVRDSDGNNSITNSIPVPQNAEFETRFAATEIECTGSTATITAEFVRGLSQTVSVFKINPDGTQTKFGNDVNGGQVTGVPAGRYLVKIKANTNTSCQFEQIVEVTEKFKPIVASVGVAFDISCSTDTPQRYRVHINNVRGGSGIYSYSYDGGNTYGVSTSGLVSGTTDIFIRDNNNAGCQPTKIRVNVDPATIKPTIPAPTLTYDCLGRASFKVEPQTPTGKTYLYEYAVDGGVKSPAYNNLGERIKDETFLLFPKTNGDPYKIQVYYTDQNALQTERNMLFKDDFGTGYEECDNTLGTVLTCANGKELELGHYSKSEVLKASTTGVYISPAGTGRLLSSYVGDANTIIYKKTIGNVLKERELDISFNYINLLPLTSSLRDPNIQVKVTINGQSHIRNIVPPAKGQTWATAQVSFTELRTNLIDNTQIDFEIIVTNNNTILAIDDIDISQPTKRCQIPVDVFVTPQAGNSFSPTFISSKNPDCVGGEGEVIFEVKNFNPLPATFEFSIDNGANWVNAQRIGTTERYSAKMRAGSYVFTVRKEAGCEVDVKTDLVITDPQRLSFVTSTLKQTPIGCEAPYLTSMVTFTAQGGTQPYKDFKYRLVGTTTWTPVNNVFSADKGIVQGLAAGRYEFTFTDSKNCSVDEVLTTFEVKDKTDVTAKIVETKCYSGNDDARVSIEVLTGEAPYQFSKDGGVTFVNTPVANSNTLVFTNLSQGTYPIVVKDRYGCKFTQSVSIHNTMSLDVVADGALTCAPASKETIAIKGEGGGNTKTLRWKRVSETNYRPSTDTDSGKVTFAITQAGSSTQATEAKVEITEAGDYEFEFKDENDCVVVKNISIILENPEWIAPFVFKSDRIACTNGTTGFIGIEETIGVNTIIRAIDISRDININKGVPPFNLVVKKDGALPTDPNLGTRGLSKGTYVVYVEDAKGCKTPEQRVVIDEIPAPNLNLTAQGVTCTSGTTNYGSITATWTTGGTAPFRVSLYNERGALARNSQTNVVHQYAGLAASSTHQFIGLTAGQYKVVMIDANNCRTEAVATVTSTEAQIDVVPQPVLNCTDKAKAKIYVYSNTGLTLNPSQIAVAIYRGSNPSTINAAEWKPVNTTAVTHTVAGASHTAYEVEIDNLNPGATYSFVVRNNGCYTIYDVGMPAMEDSTTMSVKSVEGLSACGSDNGRVKFELENIPTGVTSINYQIYRYPSHTSVGTTNFVTYAGGATASHTEISNTLGAGEYYVLFTDNTGCNTASAPFSIRKAPQPLFVTLALTKNENCNASAVVLAKADGGESNYKYIFKGNNTLPTDAEWAAVTAVSSKEVENKDNIKTATSTTWYVFVKDNLGCVSQAQVGIVKDPEPVINTITPDKLCNSNGQRELNVLMTTLGVGRHYYTIERNGVKSAPNTININPTTKRGTIYNIYSDPAPQTLEIYDANGCKAAATTFTVLDKISYELEITKKIDCQVGNEKGRVTIKNITNFDATKTYQYKVSYVQKYVVQVLDPATGNLIDEERETPITHQAAQNITTTGTSFDVQNDGIYRVEIYDVANPTCPVIRNVVVYPKEVPNVVELSVVDESCYGTTNIGQGTGKAVILAGTPSLGGFKFKIEKATELSDNSLLTIPALYGQDNQTSVTDVIDVDATGTMATYHKLKGSPVGVEYEISATSIPNGCKSIIKVVVKSPRDITIATNAVKVNQFACGSGQTISNASIIVDTAGVSGGNGEYIYSFYEGATEVQSGPSPELIVTNQLGGTYTIKVTDKLGCEKAVTGTFVVDAYNSITEVKATMVPGTEVTCTSTESINVEITTDPVAVTTGTTYTYVVQGISNSYLQTVAGVTTTTQLFTGLGAGAYKITAINNKTGCESYANYEVKDPNAFVITATDAKSVTCYGGNDGEIKLTFVDTDLSNRGGINEATGGFTYSIQDIYDPTNNILNVSVAGDTAIVTGLKASLYEVVATSNTTGCTIKNKVQFGINQPFAELTGSASLEYGATCTNNQGEILVDIIGGVAPYKIELVDAAGVVINNAYGDPLVAEDIYGKHLFIGLEGGATPGTIRDYFVRVTDAGGCDSVTFAPDTTTTPPTPQLPIKIENPNQITSGTPIVVGTTCPNSEDGSIEIPSVAGGSGIYYYELFNRTTGRSYSLQTSNKFSNLPKGDYDVYIIDQWGCSLNVTNIDLQDPAPIEVVETGNSDEICFENPVGGSKTIKLQGGNVVNRLTGANDGYTIRLINSATKITIQQFVNQPANTDIVISDLRQGESYEIQVIDANGCVIQNNFGPFSIKNTPSIEVSRIYFEETCSTGAYESLLKVEFKKVFDVANKEKLRYALNSTNVADAKKFDEFNISTGLIYSNIDPNDLERFRKLEGGDSQFMTIFYLQDELTPATSGRYCQLVTKRFDLDNVEKLGLEPSPAHLIKTDNHENTGAYLISYRQEGNLPINQIKVDAKFGVPGYNYYFNGVRSEEGIYKVQQTDPDYYDASGKRYKEIVVRVEDKTGHLNSDAQGNVDENGNPLPNVPLYTRTPCSAEIIIHYEFLDIEIPRYFTPTGDGMNDTWAPRYTDFYPNMTVDIYDRYGRLLANLKFGESWDGKLKGKELPTGDYWYIFKLNEYEDDDRVFKGHFTLYR